MTDKRTQRGQTTLDYTIAILVFIAVVLFVFLFVPGIFEPFGGGEGEDPAVADRIGNTISHDMLSGTDQPRRLDRQCTIEFFDDNPDASKCDNFDEEDLEDRLSLRGFDQVNVTIRGNLTGNGREMPCWDEGSNEWASPGCGGTELRVGDPLPQESTATITATRVVSLQGTPVTVEVRVW